jgi:hypothetical protein
VLRAAADVADERRQAHPWETLVAKWLSDPRHPERQRDGVTTTEILLRCLHQDKSKLGRGDEMQIASILRILGWTNVLRKRLGGCLFRVYRPVNIVPTLIQPDSSDPTSKGSNVVRLTDRRARKRNPAIA